MTVHESTQMDLTRPVVRQGVPVTSLDRTILDLLEGGEGRGTRKIADAIGLSTRSTRTRLARLVTRGLVREVGTGPHDPRRRYMLALD